MPRNPDSGNVTKQMTQDLHNFLEKILHHEILNE